MSLVRRLSIFLFILLSTLLLLGCPWSSERTFEPVNKDQKVTMFDRYRLDLYSHLPSRFRMMCEVKFLTPHKDSLRLDTIPVFLIDSICLKGNCVGGILCEEVIDVFTQYYDRPLVPGDPPPISPIAKEMRFNQYLTPGRYSIEGTKPVPFECQDRDLEVWIYARLLDRLSRLTIAAETKRIPFRIFTRRGVALGS